MSRVMEWDELNLLRTTIPDLFTAWKSQNRKAVDRWCDYMEFVLCLIYAYGWKDAEEIVGIVPFRDGLDDKAVNLEIDGETYRDRIFRQLEEGSSDGVLRIIDTEAHRDYNTGVYDAGKSCGVSGIKKQWQTMKDERVRDPHSYLQGVKVGLDDLFYTYTGDAALFPGGFGVPELDCGCRCWVVLSK